MAVRSEHLDTCPYGHGDRAVLRASGVEIHSRLMLAPRFTSSATFSSVAVVLGLGLGLGLGLVPGCSSVSIAAKEAMGYTKRDQLVDRVEAARDQQTEAKEQFASALEEFMAVTGAAAPGTKAGDLEAKYKKLSKAFEASESEAAAVNKRIGEVETVANKLFKEWQQELDQYTNASLRSASERQLADTKQQYAKLIGAMKAAEGKMQPVLDAFRDQVLFLKHNLNAQAISSLGSTVTEIQGDVTRLIQEMEASISEADSFIREMGMLDGGG